MTITKELFVEAIARAVAKATKELQDEVADLKRANAQADNIVREQFMELNKRIKELELKESMANDRINALEEELNDQRDRIIDLERTVEELDPTDFGDRLDTLEGKVEDLDQTDLSYRLDTLEERVDDLPDFDTVVDEVIDSGSFRDAVEEIFGDFTGRLVISVG